MRARKEKVIATLTGGLKQLAAKRNVRVVRPGRRSRTRKRCGWIRWAASRWPTTACSSSIASWPPAPARRGSRPSTCPRPRVMDSTGALELPDVPESLLVVGGGYIGLEMGTVYAALGSRVSVVEMTDGLLPGADRDLVKPLHKRLEKRVRGHLPQHQGGQRWPTRQDAIEVTFEGDVDEEGRSGSAACWCAVGRRPNSAGLGLENTKVQVDAQGLRRRSISSGARPTRTSWPSATWPASRCWPTRRPTKGKVAVEASGRRAGGVRAPRHSRPWCSPIRKSPGPG